MAFGPTTRMWRRSLRSGSTPLFFNKTMDSCPMSRANSRCALQLTSCGRSLDHGTRLEAPETEGIQRRGIILAFLTRFKQICNHPSQWLGDGAYSPADSGKFHRLRELGEEIASKQEKVLVFTQYREITDPLARHLAGVFGQAEIGRASCRERV